jgi:hypothetical protein
MLDTRQLRRVIVTTAVLAAATAPAAAARTDTPSSPRHGRQAVVAQRRAPQEGVPARVESMAAYNAPVTRNTRGPAEPVVTSTDHAGLPSAAVAIAGLALAGLVLVGVAVLRRRPRALPGDASVPLTGAHLAAPANGVGGTPAAGAAALDAG